MEFRTNGKVDLLTSTSSEKTCDAPHRAHSDRQEAIKRTPIRQT